MPAAKRSAGKVASKSPASSEKPVEAPVKTAKPGPVVSVKDGVLTVDLARIANSPQGDREARTAEVRKVLDRFAQDPHGVIG